MKKTFLLLIVTIAFSCNSKQDVIAPNALAVLTFKENGVLRSFNQDQVTVEVFEHFQGGSKIILSAINGDQNFLIQVDYESPTIVAPKEWCLSSFSSSYYDYPARYHADEKKYYNPSFIGNITSIKNGKMSMQFEGSFRSGTTMNITHGLLNASTIHFN